MEEHELFEALSSQRRLGILSYLIDDAHKFSEIQRTLEISSPELSRQVNRLQKTGLIERSANNAYALTLYGKLIQKNLRLLRFFAEKSEFFSTHETSPIPAKMIERMGALSGGVILNSAYELLDKLKVASERVKGYYWDLSDDFPRLLLDKVEIMVDNEVEIKCVYPRKLVEGIKESVSPKIVQAVKMKSVDEVNITIVASDAFGMVGLPESNGRVDRGQYIYGESEEFIDWCKDCFQLYWEKAPLY